MVKRPTSQPESKTFYNFVQLRLWMWCCLEFYLTERITAEWKNWKNYYMVLIQEDLVKLVSLCFMLLQDLKFRFRFRLCCTKLKNSDLQYGPVQITHSLQKYEYHPRKMCFMKVLWKTCPQNSLLPPLPHEWSHERQRKSNQIKNIGLKLQFWSCSLNSFLLNKKKKTITSPQPVSISTFKSTAADNSLGWR